MNQFRVATLNIWGKNGPWERRLAVLREQLRELNPDVIGLQEVVRSGELDQAALIAQGLGYHIAWGRASQGFGNAVLSKWPIRRAVCHELPSVVTREARSAVYAEIDSPMGILPFFSTHLSWMLEDGFVRQRQVRSLTDFVDRMAPAASRIPSGWTGHSGARLGPWNAGAEAEEQSKALDVKKMLSPVIAGDFNAEPESDEIRFMQGWTNLGGESVYFMDCFGRCGDGDEEITFSRENSFASLAYEPGRRIDYLFVRRASHSPELVRVVDAKLCFNRAVDGVFATDHFGVTAVLEYVGTPSA